MQKKLLFALLGALSLIPTTGFAQTPDGTDINQAIPIYFGQTVNDTVDSVTRSHQIYSITLAKGQNFSAIVKGPDIGWYFLLYGPNQKTTAGSSCYDAVANAGCNQGGTSRVLEYTSAVAGTYYLYVGVNSGSAAYQLQVTATGTPIATPNPASAGCVTGQVDSITYSLQLIAASLPDEVSIGGTKLCPTCTVKPPAYPQLVNKLETAMGLNVGVSACYDAAGNIFQLKMTHP